MKILTKLSLLGCLMISLSACAEQKVVPTSSVLYNLEQAVATLQAKTKLPIVIPSYLPKRKTAYYAYAEIIPNGYVINVDATSTCHGAKYCSLGYVQALVHAQPRMLKDRDGKVITQIIKQNGVKYYYTAGHAMGDYFPAQIQWMQQQVMVTIAAPHATQAILLKIASSCVTA
tara:strand:- start:24327 stop:24845 length:519 start_codon:yes stop_codon:yes gene_type:complete